MSELIKEEVNNTTVQQKAKRGRKRIYSDEERKERAKAYYKTHEKRRERAKAYYEQHKQEIHERKASKIITDEERKKRSLANKKYKQGAYRARHLEYMKQYRKRPAYMEKKRLGSKRYYYAHRELCLKRSTEWAKRNRVSKKRDIVLKGVANVEGIADFKEKLLDFLTNVKYPLGSSIVLTIEGIEPIDKPVVIKKVVQK